MEYGPRALGNRSILANPTIPGMDDKVNEEIKFREKWRPFCPSMLDEAKEDFLEDPSESPFMVMTFKIRHERREQVPSIVHADAPRATDSQRVGESPLLETDQILRRGEWGAGAHEHLLQHQRGYDRQYAAGCGTNISGDRDGCALDRELHREEAGGWGGVGRGLVGSRLSLPI